eukprot:TRINITY_DN2669_c3_g3_i1.p1 TRINITY_DN2669_c3_g3~~TRINITY_DN2669_c3_g3_i1.p1  ORF type:complete len:427 (+),score=129.33 TRINITY_DN2669_c3_g3_i1:56-1282(+)
MDNNNIAARCPAAFKKLVPYFIRARDFGSRDPQVSYLCKSFAAQVGIGLLGALDPTVKDEATAFLMELMDHLETEKADPVISGGDGKEVLLRNAYLIFKRADDRERSGQADKQCIAMFTTSSVLLECTKQFGDMDEDVQEKYNYARYTAMQVKKALDSGVPYVSPNPSLETQDTPMESPSQHVDPMAPVEPQPFAPPLPEPPVAFEPPAPVAPMVSTPEPLAPPPPPPLDDLDALMSSLQAPTSSAIPDAQPTLPESDSMDLMEERLRKLAGGVGEPAAPVPAPENVELLKAEASLSKRRVDELENELMQLKHQLVMSQTQTQQAQGQCQKYEQVVNMMKAQMAQASGGGGGSGIVVPVVGFEPTLDHMVDAQKYAKYIISSLQFKDMVTARENAVKVMSLINGHPLQ